MVTLSYIKFLCHSKFLIFLEWKIVYQFDFLRYLRNIHIELTVRIIYSLVSRYILQLLLNCLIEYNKRKKIKKI